jgi:hypothetical protein
VGGSRRTAALSSAEHLQPQLQVLDKTRQANCLKRINIINFTASALVLLRFQGAVGSLLLLQQIDRDMSGKEGGSGLFRLFSGSSKEDDGNATAPKKKMSMLRVKKKVATQLSKTTIGRGTVIKLLGTQGHEAVVALLNTATEVAGAAMSKELKAHIFKLIYKCGVLIQENLITREDVDPAWDQTIDMFNAILDTLETPWNESNIHQLDAKKLKAKIMESHDKLIPVIKNHMKEKNSGKLTALYTFYSAENLIKTFVTSPKLLAERESVRTSLRMLLCADAQGDFNSYLDGEGVPKGPPPPTELMGYLKEPAARKFFQSFVTEQGKLADLQFWLAVEDYKKLSSSSLMEDRSERIFDKFLGASAPCPVACVPVEEVAAIEAKVTVGQGRRGVFDKAQVHALEQLKGVYEGGFLQSQDQQEFTNSTSEPRKSARRRGSLLVSIEAALVEGGDDDDDIVIDED